MSRKPGLQAGNVAGGIAVVLMIVIAGTVLGGCASPVPGNDNHEATVTVTPTSTATPTAMATATPTPVPTPTQTPTPAPTPVPEEVARTYQWTIDGRSYTASFSMPVSDYGLYAGRAHARGSDYGGYRIADDERVYFDGIASQLVDAARNSGSGDEDAARAVVTFLQSLPEVTADKIADDDYPMFPAETLIEGGGDSEDMSILAANLLDLMGYDTVLLGFPGHMAIGLQSDEDLPGRYYSYDGARYYYQEIMPPLRGFGDIPDAYRNTSATIYTMQAVAGVRLSMDVNEESADELFVYYHVSCNVKNGGPEAAKNVSVYFAALALDYGEDRVWPFETEVNIGDIPVGESQTVEATVKIPRSGPTQIECIASGDNFDPVTAKGEQFRL